MTIPIVQTLRFLIVIICIFLIIIAFDTYLPTTISNNTKPPIDSTMIAKIDNCTYCRRVGGGTEISDCTTDKGNYSSRWFRVCKKRLEDRFFQHGNININLQNVECICSKGGRNYVVLYRCKVSKIPVSGRVAKAIKKELINGKEGRTPDSVDCKCPR